MNGSTSGILSSELIIDTGHSEFELVDGGNDFSAVEEMTTQLRQIADARVAQQTRI